MGQFFSATPNTTGTTMAAKAQADEWISSKKVVMISKGYCPYCTQAKKMFKEHIGKDLDASDYLVIEIDSRDDCDAIQNYMQKLTGGRSVPRVFINGKFVGGCDDTMALHKNGKLSSMLKA